MKKKFFQISSIIMLVILVLALVTLAAGAVAKSNLAKQYPAPGQLVDVGGYKMHIYCTGQGSSTVILGGGTLENSLFWAGVQPEVARYTRVCSYDRAGSGWSEPGPQPRTATIMAEELHTLLVNAHIEGPYVLVGHSMGGLLMRVYTYNYPEEVVGMIMVDSLHEGQIVRLPEIQKRLLQEGIRQVRMLALLRSTNVMALAPQFIPNPGIPDDAYAQLQATTATSEIFETNVAELEVMEASFNEVLALRIASFGDLPLIVLSAGLKETTPSLSDAENQQRLDEWQALQSELVTLSTNSKQIIAEQSGHNIQLDQPELVIESIREMLDALQK